MSGILTATVIQIVGMLASGVVGALGHAVYNRMSSPSTPAPSPAPASPASTVPAGSPVKGVVQQLLLSFESQLEQQLAQQFQGALSAAVGNAVNAHPLIVGTAAAQPAQVPPAAAAK
jgi:hypothetical protein